MKKILLLLIIFLFCKADTCFAFHLKGGWIQYEYISTDSVAKTHRYRITVRQYLSCSSSGGQIDPDVYLGIFDGETNLLFQKITVPLSYTDRPSITTFDPCINPTPLPGSVCYRIDVYVTTVNLPFNNAGYALAVQRCCRIGGIVNLVNSDQLGVTYYNKIPGFVIDSNYAINSSPSFLQKDTVIICKNTPFTFDFSATDAEGDSISYIFCEGLHGGNPGSQGGARPDPPANPPYNIVDYSQGFSGSFPLGTGVQINSISGLISGIAPSITGDYVIAVCALEYRKRVLIGITKKEIHINVANCQLSAAELNPTYITCNGFDLQFQNESSATGINAYLWSFGDGQTDTVPTPLHHYSDTGVYNLKLIVKAQGCTDSATAIVRIFPGFIPSFDVNGFCYQNPFYFTNTTYAKYGKVDSVFWDFGETSLNNDTSTLKNPNYKYLTPGPRKVLLYAHSSKGCEDTTSKIVVVLDKPPISLAFKDTLICSIDSVTLGANSNATTFFWSPNINISNRNIASPYVFPKDTTKYILTVIDKGCINKDTVTINVLDFITVDAGPNSNVCLTDTFKMQTKSYALSYLWTPALTLIDSTIKYPLAVPTQPSTKYYVKANLGKCQDRDSVTLFTFPYPKAKLSNDATICFGDSVKITGTYEGDFYNWSPTTTLSDSTILTPFASPKITTNYLLYAQYLSGCLKKVFDTVEVKVIQPFYVFAGRDTSIVYNQPLQLFALIDDNTDKKFIWSSNPFSAINYLNNNNFQNPIATLPITIDSVAYSVKAFTKENCFTTDDLKVKVFKTQPDIFVPDAFTPNGDGKNDVIKPIPVGVTKLDYFNIYNRWGQLLFTTSQIGKGWNGTINGTFQSSGTFIYTVQGVDYKGKIINKKGTIVLIR